LLRNQEDQIKSAVPSMPEQQVQQPLHNNYVRNEDSIEQNRTSESLSYLPPVAESNSNHDDHNMLVNDEEEIIEVTESHGDDVTGRSYNNDVISRNDNNDVMSRNDTEGNVEDNVIADNESIKSPEPTESLPSTPR
jgi:hypothetical protein